MFFLAAQKPLIVKYVNDLLGEPVYQFQMAVTVPFWNWLFGAIGMDTTAEKVFGPYSPETAIPWYTIMFFIACVLSVIIIYLFKGKLSKDDPKNPQLTLEAGFLAIKDLVTSVIGEHGYKYFPVVATFAVLILVSNLMSLFPLFLPPTEHVNVTYALGFTSFLYYNYVGISENGFLNHIKHFAGPKLPIAIAIIMTPLIFGIELVSNLIRPMTLGLRLFANMFADAQVAGEAAQLFAPYSHFVFPVLVMPVALFVSFVQTLVFTLLSMIYVSEVSHASHDHGHDDEHHDDHAEGIEAEPAAA